MSLSENQSEFPRSFGPEEPLEVKGKVFGYRVWRVRKSGLYSVRNSVFPWPDDRPQTATCYRNFILLGSHLAPQEGCSCGLYAYRTPPPPNPSGHPMGADPYGSHVWGVVELSGKVVVHKEGYRAQYAKPVAVVYNAHAEEIAQKYRLIIVEDLADWGG